MKIRRMDSARFVKRLLTLGLFLALLLAFAPDRLQAAQGGLPESMPRLTVQEGDTQRSNAFFLRPLLSWLADPSAVMDVDGALTAAIEDRFQPLNKLPRTEAAVLWLCLPVDISGADSTLLNLHLGQGLPGRVSVFAPSGATTFTEWQNIRATGTLTLNVTKQPGQGAVPIFIRMEGVPNPWFSPRLMPVTGTEPGGPESWTPFLTGLFAAVWLFGLLGGLRSGALWRLWCALIAVLVLLHLVYGQAITPKGYVPFEGLPGLLGLCIGILLLPHVGRSLMHTAGRAPVLDRCLRICCFVMALVALLPFVPGMAWLTRFTPLWPVLTILLLPFALGACIRGLPHAVRFLVGCLLTISTVLPDAIFLCMGSSPLGSSQSGLWGLAIALLLFSSARPLSLPAAAAPSGVKESGSSLLPKAFTVEESESRRQVTLPKGNAPVSYLMDAVAPLPEGADSEQAAASSEAGVPESADARPAPPPPVLTEERLTAPELEKALHLPLVTLLDALEPFNEAAVPEELRVAAETVRQAGHALSDAASDPAAALANQEALPTLETVFTLSDLIDRVRGATEPAAKAAGLALAFSLPADIAEPPYTGDLTRLDAGLRMLIHSAIQATDEGVVHIAVRQHPDSPAPGHLLFTVRDTGTRIAPEERSLSALYRAWGLASSYKYSLSFESDPGQGTVVSFGVRLIPASAEAAAFTHSDAGTLALAKAHSSRRQRLLQAIVADDVAQSRQTLIQSLSDLPQPPLEARNPTEALYLYRRVPVGLIIMDGDMLEADMLESIRGIRAHEHEHRLPPVPLVVLVNHPLQGRLFVDEGATEMLLKPVSRQVLTAAVRRLTSMLESGEERAQPPVEAVEPESPTEPPVEEAPAEEPQEAPEVQEAAPTPDNTPEAPNPEPNPEPEPESEPESTNYTPHEALELVREDIDQSRSALESGDFDDLKQAATRILTQAKAQEWRIIEGIATYVVRAADAGDAQAVQDLMPDLELSVERMVAQLDQAGQTE